MSIQIPRGPAGQPILGNLGQFRRDPLGYLENLARYGDITRTRFGPVTILSVHHPDLVHEVLVSQAEKFHKTRGMKAIFKDSLGNGLLTSDGEFWKRQRRLVQPAFHARRIAAYADVMVEHAQRLLDEWQAHTDTGQTLDVAAEMMRLTLGIVTKVLFDADVSDQASRVGEAIAVGQEITSRRFNSLIRLPRWVPTRDNQRGLESLRVIDEVVMGMIEERRAAGEDRGDLLSMLLMAVDEEGSGGMTNRQVRDEAITLFLAGHDTTANTLNWTFSLLAQHPEVEARLHAELDSALGGRAPTFDDLPRLRVAEMAIKEAMRLYPPAWIISREAVQDLWLKGHRVKQGTIIFISPYALHRNPQWFEKPTQFIPERFDEGAEERIPKYAYIPFSAGPRICIGNSFALMEARLILATLAQQVRLSLPPGHIVEPEPLVTLRPKDGLPMRITERQVVAEGAAG